MFELETAPHVSTYDAWLRKVGDEVYLAIGLSLGDLPIIDFYGMWERGDSVYSAAKLACSTIPW